MSNWNFQSLSYWENEKIVLSLLQKKYEKKFSPKDAEKWAYRNCSTICSYLRQAKKMYEELRWQSLLSQPITLYYLMMNLWKIWILSLDPFYPERTSQLKHGISTKKKKRQPFSLLADEVRFQKEGLVAHLLKLLQRQELMGRSYTIEQLVSMIPEMQPSYWMVKQQKTLWKGIDLGEKILVLEKIPDEIIPFFQESIFSNYETNRNGILLQKTTNLHPYLLYQEGDPYLFLRKDRLIPVPEALNYFMLMFHFSMLCRYDPPLWHDVIRQEWMKESIWVNEIIHLSTHRFPKLIERYLEKEH